MNYEHTLYVVHFKNILLPRNGWNSKFLSKILYQIPLKQALKLCSELIKIGSLVFIDFAYFKRKERIHNKKFHEYFRIKWDFNVFIKKFHVCFCVEAINILWNLYFILFSLVFLIWDFYCFEWTDAFLYGSKQFQYSF